MRFASEAQRRAVMASIMGAGRRAMGAIRHAAPRVMAAADVAASHAKRIATNPKTYKRAAVIAALPVAFRDSRNRPSVLAARYTLATIGTHTLRNAVRERLRDTAKGWATLRRKEGLMRGMPTGRAGVELAKIARSAPFPLTTESVSAEELNKIASMRRTYEGAVDMGARVYKGLGTLRSALPVIGTVHTGYRLVQNLRQAHAVRSKVKEGLKYYKPPTVVVRAKHQDVPHVVVVRKKRRA